MDVEFFWIFWIGMEMGINIFFVIIKWLGKGLYENYIDCNSGVFVGFY